MIPSSSHSRGQKDMRDLEDERDAVDLAAVTGDYVAASSSDVPQQRTESAGGGVDFRAAPPAADTEDIARRVRASDGEVVLLHGGLVEGGDSADATAVLAGVGSPEGLFFCELADKTDAGTEALASPGVAVSPDGRTAYFHGGYRVWDEGDDFADADDLSIFDGDASRWTCANDDCGAGELGGGMRSSLPSLRHSRHSRSPRRTRRRDHARAHRARSRETACHGGVRRTRRDGRAPRLGVRARSRRRDLARDSRVAPRRREGPRRRPGTLRPSRGGAAFASAR